MSRTFTKLFSSITESTVWCEPDRTRLAWICMLAMADRSGRVWGSVPGLANRARIPVEDARVAIATFLAPDPDSRTPDHEGRRIEVIDGGWRLLNHEKYRAIRDEETTLESKRNYINARRARERVEGVEQSRSATNTVGVGRDNAEADTEADTRKRSSTAAQAQTLPAFNGDPNLQDFNAKQRPALASEWELPEEWGNDAERLGWKVNQILKESEKYRQYWTTGKGAGTRRTIKGWRQSWSNWLSKAERYAA